MMNTETKAHEVVVTQRFSERQTGDPYGATLHSVVVTSQVVGKKGIEKRLQLEVMQPPKVKGNPSVTIRRILSWEEVEELSNAAENLVSIAKAWRPTPDPRRSATEFSTTVSDGFAVGQQTGNRGPEYFIALRDENQSARFVIGGLEQLSEFVAHLSEAALKLR